jgi:hypothetical protein
MNSIYFNIEKMNFYSIESDTARNRKKKKKTTQHKQKMDLKESRDFQSIRKNVRFQQEFDIISDDKLGTNINIPESYIRENVGHLRKE